MDRGREAARVGRKRAAGGFRLPRNPGPLQRSERKAVESPPAVTGPSLARARGHARRHSGAVRLAGEGKADRDGSDDVINCVAPVGVDLPETNKYIVVTGISSRELDSNGDPVRILRMRDRHDLAVIAE